MKAANLMKTDHHTHPNIGHSSGLHNKGDTRSSNNQHFILGPYPEAAIQPGRNTPHGPSVEPPTSYITVHRDLKRNIDLENQTLGMNLKETTNLPQTNLQPAEIAAPTPRHHYRATHQATAPAAGDLEPPLTVVTPHNSPIPPRGPPTNGQKARKRNQPGSNIQIPNPCDTNSLVFPK